MALKKFASLTGDPDDSEILEDSDDLLRDLTRRKTLVPPKRIKEVASKKDNKQPVLNKEQEEDYEDLRAKYKNLDAKEKKRSGIEEIFTKKTSDLESLLCARAKELKDDKPVDDDDDEDEIEDDEDYSDGEQDYDDDEEIDDDEEVGEEVDDEEEDDYERQGEEREDDREEVEDHGKEEIDHRVEPDVDDIDDIELVERMDRKYGKLPTPTCSEDEVDVDQVPGNEVKVAEGEEHKEEEDEREKSFARDNQDIADWKRKYYH